MANASETTIVNILGYGKQADGDILPIRAGTEGIDGSAEPTYENVPYHGYELYGMTSTGDIVPVLIDVDRKVNITGF